MKHKFFFILNFICILLCCCLMSACKNKDLPNQNPPFVYEAPTLMYDGCQILNFYSTDYSIIKNKDDTIIQASDCFYDTINEDTYTLISKCYNFWTYCVDGGYNYTNDLGSGITDAYNFEFNENNCKVVNVYTDLNRAPTSSARRIVQNYDILFSTNHVSIVYERESYYDDIKQYIDILSTDDGIFMQYYIATYDDYSKLYHYEIYKFFYNETNEKFYYTSNQIKSGTSILTLSDIEITIFDNFILPDFLYTITIN